MLELGSKFLLSYFIGSIMGAMVVGWLRGGVDIRTMGSGNAGGTNALRTQGLLFALGVVVIDVGKGVVAAGVIPDLNLPFIGTDPDISRVWLILCCAAASVVGHVWPIWHGFRGGKGAGTYIGTLIVIAPWLIIPTLLVWAAMLIIFGYVGLATMSAATASAIYVAVTRLPDAQPLFIYCVVLAGFIIFCHRSNIGRMRAGTEFKNTKVMIFNRVRKQAD
ncbi:MAG TPA: glycerol-3-phosphate acyltransferase [Woeseiaceae bacterium]